jgi:hypothetical protein
VSNRRSELHPTSRVTSTDPQQVPREVDDVLAPVLERKTPPLDLRDHQDLLGPELATPSFDRPPPVQHLVIGERVQTFHPSCAHAFDYMPSWEARQENPRIYMAIRPRIATRQRTPGQANLISSLRFA